MRLSSGSGDGGRSFMPILPSCTRECRMRYARSDHSPTSAVLNEMSRASMYCIIRRRTVRPSRLPLASPRGRRRPPRSTRRGARPPQNQERVQFREPVDRDAKCTHAPGVPRAGSSNSRLPEITRGGPIPPSNAAGMADKHVYTSPELTQAAVHWLASIPHVEMRPIVKPAHETATGYLVAAFEYALARRGPMSLHYRADMSG